MGQVAVGERSFWLPWGRVDQKWQDWWLDQLRISGKIPMSNDEAETGERDPPGIRAYEESGWGGFWLG